MGVPIDSKSPLSQLELIDYRFVGIIMIENNCS